ncbi:ABC transporter permease [Paenibacillus albidus]|uniref:ABC transporter permease n=1 Tax=Paenibacillus albidus TaxID=2041023 RepID=UPI001BEC68FB|nr:ABC transporter permease [Paenibacillus albidus]MBT2291850.1 ABC transporter permease [Paenibacillus albidus]
MKEFQIELKKISRSKHGFVIFAVTLLFAIATFTIISVLGLANNSFTFFLRSFSAFTYFPAFIPPVALSCLLFSREIQDRTLIYAFMRPISNHRLLRGKVLATLVFCWMVVILYALLALIYSISFFPVSSSAYDHHLVEGFIRCLLFTLYTCVGTAIGTMIAVLVCLLVRNMIGSYVVSIVLIIMLNLMNLKLDFLNLPFQLPISTFVNPASYYTIEFNDFVQRLVGITCLNLFVILVLFVLSARLFAKIRRGKGNI